MTNCTMFGIVVKVNRSAQTIFLPTNNTTITYWYRGGPFGLAARPQWATISCVALSTSTPFAATHEFDFVWDGSKCKSAGSDHLFAYKRYYNLVCVLRWSSLGWPTAPHRAPISCVALSTSTPSDATDQLILVLNRRKGKSTGSDHLLAY
jgi:hypothetical protein